MRKRVQGYRSPWGLSNDDVRLIDRLRVAGCRRAEIARVLRIGETAVDKVLSRQLHRDVERHPDLPWPSGSARGERHGHARLTDADVEDIRRQVKEGVRQADLARRYEVSPATVCNIVARRSRTGSGVGTRRVPRGCVEDRMGGSGRPTVT